VLLSVTLLTANRAPSPRDDGLFTNLTHGAATLMACESDAHNGVLDFLADRTQRLGIRHCTKHTALPTFVLVFGADRTHNCYTVLKKTNATRSLLFVIACNY